MPAERARSTGRKRRGNDAGGAFGASGAALVKFSVVQIREFERVVGDNPSCSSGVPVSIGWNHGKTFTMNLEDFEKARPPRRAQMDLVLTRGERHRLLVEWGASGHDVIEAIRMIIRVKNQRRQTVNNLGSYDRVEEVCENLSRSLKNMVFRSSTGSLARKLKADSERAATLKKMNATGRAASPTAEEASAVASGRLNGQDRTSNLQDARKPPFEEVSLREDFDTSSNSDAGELQLSPRDEGAGEKMLPEVLEEFSAGSSGRNKLPHYAKLPTQSSTAVVDIADLYDDVDDMSNPQSHDHLSVRAPTPKRALISTIGRMVDT